MNAASALVGLIAAVVLVGPGLLPVSADGSAVSGVVETDAAVSLSGEVRASSPEGAVHLRTAAEAVQFMRLDAEELTIDFAWREGVHTVNPTTLPPPRYLTAVGQDKKVYTGMTGTFSAFGDTPELLAMMPAGSGELAGAAAGTSSARTLVNEVIVKVERPGEYQVPPGTFGPGGFEYAIVGSAVGIFSLDEATITGSFIVFMNNVTLEGRAQEGAFRHWSGQWVNETTPGVYESHTRITVLDVRDGVLDLGGTGHVMLVGPHVGTFVDGRVTADSVQGTFLSSSHRYRFPPAPLDMQGTGRVSLGALAGPGAIQGEYSRAAPARLAMDASGDFAVVTTEGLEATPLSNAGAALPRPPAWAWIVGVAGVILVAAAMPLSRRDRWRLWWASRQDQTYRAWLMTAYGLEECQDREAAAEVYRRVTRRYPLREHGWLHLVENLVESGRHQEALEASAKAERACRNASSEMLALRAMAMYSTGLKEDAVRLLDTLADHDPGQACEVLERPQFAHLRQASPRLARLQSPRPGPAPTGYL